MKTIQPGNSTTVTTAAAIAVNRFVGFDGNYPAADAKALGVSNDAADSGTSLGLVVDGIVFVEASAAISVGAKVTTTNTGKAKTVSASEAVNGYAMDAASADGDLIRVLLK